jgi:hypothetical protein
MHKKTMLFWYDCGFFSHTQNIQLRIEQFFTVKCVLLCPVPQFRRSFNLSCLRPHLVSPVRYPKRCMYALFPYQLILELVLKT